MKISRKQNLNGLRKCSAEWQCCSSFYALESKEVTQGGLRKIRQQQIKGAIESKAGKSLGLDKKQNGGTLASLTLVGIRQLTFTAHKDSGCGDKMTAEGFVVSCWVLAVVLWWRGLDSSDLSMYVILDAKRQQTGSLKGKIDLYQGSYKPRTCLPIMTALLIRIFYVQTIP